MDAMRQSWTDDRLDDFRAEVNHRFDEVYRRFDEVDRRFEDVDRRFERVEGQIHNLRVEMSAGFQRIDERFERLYRLIISVGAGFTGAVVLAAITSHLF